MKVCVFRYEHPRSKRMADALEAGVMHMGWELVATAQPEMAKKCGADMLMAYGWVNRPLFDYYRSAGRSFLYLDLGYWTRKVSAGDYSGFHKAVVNARHATAYFKRGRPLDRMEDAPIIQPGHFGGDHIVVAGLSGKSAESFGFRPMEWEQQTVEAIRKLCDRPIVYRPKPSWRDARPIAGTRFSSSNETIGKALAGAYGLVTLQSNAAIDALAAGIPHYAEQGLASVVGCRSLEELVKNPRQYHDREQFLADVGYCHWRRSEMEDGSMFRQFLIDGFLA